ncbi:hypothetical protein MRB53_023637 [Persea americana]|uniref:Uncharacterized protein n=1 Tax=Persea americana TaxID=3435 RepID=A0ACC2LB91_PERAE|nr:hypothetical protein MRB53_023637 [Persea americana]
METQIPVKIGTKGTIASLLSQEMEYFRRLELDRQTRADMGSSGPKSGFQTTTKIKNKKRGFWLLPSICSCVEIANERKERLLSYKKLKIDVKEGERLGRA